MCAQHQQMLWKRVACSGESCGPSFGGASQVWAVLVVSVSSSHYSEAQTQHEDATSVKNATVQLLDGHLLWAPAKRWKSISWSNFVRAPSALSVLRKYLLLMRNL